LRDESSRKAHRSFAGRVSDRRIRSPRAAPKEDTDEIPTAGCGRRGAPRGAACGDDDDDDGGDDDEITVVTEVAVEDTEIATETTVVVEETEIVVTETTEVVEDGAETTEV
jgi:hypothetical protein